MPAGFEVWDADGNPIISITDRVTRVLGQVETGASGGSQHHPSLSEGEPWAYVQINQALSFSYVAPSVYFSGNNIIWTYDVDPSHELPAPARIVYGVY